MKGSLVCAVGDETDLHQGSRHLHTHEHDEGSLLDAPGATGVDFSQPGLGETREFARFPCVLIRDQVAKDRDQRVVDDPGRSRLGIKGRVLPQRNLARIRVAGLEG